MKGKKAKSRSSKGITNTTLVITIIVLLILAAIIISVSTNSGVIDTAGIAVIETERAGEKEELDFAITQYAMQNKKVDAVGLSNYLKNAPYNFAIDDIEEITEGTDKFTVTVKNHTFEVSTATGTANIEDDTTSGDGETTPGAGETTPGTGDTTPGTGETTPGTGDTTTKPEVTDTTKPVISANVTSTTSTITINVTKVADDNLETKIKYYYCIYDANNKLVKSTETTSTTHVFEGLEAGASYTAKVEVDDMYDNTGEYTKSITTQSVPNVSSSAIKYSPSTATAGSVIFTTDYSSTEYTLMYVGPTGDVPFTNSIEVKENQKVIFYLKDANDNRGANYEVDVNWIDKASPVIEATTTSTATTVEVKVSGVTDANLPTTIKYKYYISLDNKNYGTAVEAATNSYTFTGLTQGTKYYVKVEVVDSLLNVGKKELEQQTKSMPTVDDSMLSYSKDLTNDKVTITSKYTGDYTLMYKLEGEEKFVEYTSPIEVTENQKVIFYLKDKNGATGAQKEIDITWIDTTEPVLEVNTVGKSTSIEVTVNNVTDENLSENITYKYYISKDGKVYDPGKESTSNTYTFEELDENTTYYIKVEVKDIAGNIGKQIIEQPTKTIPQVEDSAIAYSPTTWTNDKVTFTSTYTSNEYTLVYSIEGAETFTPYTKPIEIATNKKVSFYLQDGEGVVGAAKEIDVDWIDKNAPIVESVAPNEELTSMLVTFSDDAAGVEKIAIISMNETKPSAENFVEITEHTIVDESHVIVNSLDLNQIYFVWVMDAAGNISNEGVQYCSANLEMTEEAVISPQNIVNTSVTVTLPTQSGQVYTQYQIVSKETEFKENGTWTRYNSDEPITIDNNCFIYYRYSLFGEFPGEYKVAEVKNIDKQGPKVQQIASSNTSIKVRVDDGDGIGIYQYGTASVEMVPTTLTDIDTETNIIEIPLSEGQTTIYIYVTDKLGNHTIQKLTGGEGLKIKATNKTSTSVTLTATALNSNEIGTELKWYIGKDKDTLKEQEPITKTYAEGESRTLNYAEGEDYEYYYVYVEDNLGNVATLDFRFDKSDKTMPEISVETIQYNNATEDVTIKITDSESGILEYHVYNVTTAEEISVTPEEAFVEGAKSVTINLTYDVGTSIRIETVDRKENNSEVTYNLEGDITKPIITITDLIPHKDNGVCYIDVGLTIADNTKKLESGLEDYDVYIDNELQEEYSLSEKGATFVITNLENKNVLKVVAYDNAGNVSEQTKTITDSEPTKITISKDNLTYKVVDGENIISSTITIEDGPETNLSMIKSGVDSYYIEIYDEKGLLVDTKSATDLGGTNEPIPVSIDVPNGGFVSVEATDLFENPNTISQHFSDYDGPIITIEPKSYYVENGVNKINSTITLKDEKSGVGVVKVYVNNEAYGTYNGNGSQNYSIPGIIANNDSNIRVEAIDIFGNDNSDNKTVVDDEAPTAVIDDGTASYSVETLALAMSSRARTDSAELIKKIKVNVKVSDNESGVGVYKIYVDGAVYGEYNGSGAKTHTTPVTLQNNGIIRVEIEDTFGNSGELEEKTVADNEPPTAAIEGIAYLDGKKINATVTVKDPKSGVGEYKIYVNDQLYDTFDGNGLKSSTQSNIIVDNNSTIKVIATDKFENLQITPTEVTLSDSEKPTINFKETSYVVRDGENLVNVDVTINDAKSGVGYYQIIVDGEIYIEDDGKGSKNISEPGIEVKNNGKIEVIAYDRFENKGEVPKTVSDSKGPTISIEKTDYSGNDKIYVSIKVSDSQSGLDSYTIYLNDTIVQEKKNLNGAKEDSYPEFLAYDEDQLTIIATDMFGTANTVSENVTDSSGPNIKINAEGILYNSVDNIYVPITISDAHAGIEKYKITVDGVEGPYEHVQEVSKKEITTSVYVKNGSVIFIEAIDKFNNISDSGKVTITDDESPIINTPEVLKYYQTEDGKYAVKLQVKVVDNKSGIDTYSITTYDAAGNKIETKEIGEGLQGKGIKELPEILDIENGGKVVVKAKDMFGNETDELEYTVEDSTAPTITHEISSWNTVDSIAVKVKVSDDKAGVGEYVIEVYNENDELVDSILENGAKQKSASSLITVANKSTIKVVAKDQFENISDEYSALISDVSAPSINLLQQKLYKDENGNNCADISIIIKDSESGIGEYTIQVDGTTVLPDKVTKNDGKTLVITQTIFNLSTITVNVSDRFGNVGEEKSLTVNEPNSAFKSEGSTGSDGDVELEEIPEPEDATISTTELTTENVIVTLVKDNVYTLQYRINDEEDWITYEEPIVMESNGKITYRLTNLGTEISGASKSITIPNIDKEAPIVEITPRSAASVNIYATDNLSGIVKIAITETEDEPLPEDWTIVSYSGTKIHEDVIGDLSYGVVYYAWAMDNLGLISEPESFMTEVKQISGITYTPDTVTTGNVTVTLPTDSIMTTTYQVIKDGETFDEANEWTTYTEPFEITENAVIYSRYEYNEDYGEYVTVNINNIDREGPVVALAARVRDTLRVTVNDAHEIKGYVIKEENITPDANEFIALEETDTNTQIDLLEFDVSELTAGGYIWFIDEVGNIGNASQFDEVYLTGSSEVSYLGSLNEKIKLSNIFSPYAYIRIFVPNVENVEAVMAYKYIENEDGTLEMVEGSEQLEYIKGETSILVKLDDNANVAILMAFTDDREFGNMFVEVNNLQIDNGPEISILDQTKEKTTFNVKHDVNEHGEEYDNIFAYAILPLNFPSSSNDESALYSDSEIGLMDSALSVIKYVLKILFDNADLFIDCMDAENLEIVLCFLLDTDDYTIIFEDEEIANQLAEMGIYPDTPIKDMAKEAISFIKYMVLQEINFEDQQGAFIYSVADFCTRDDKAAIFSNVNDILNIIKENFVARDLQEGETYPEYLVRVKQEYAMQQAEEDTTTSSTTTEENTVEDNTVTEDNTTVEDTTTDTTDTTTEETELDTSLMNILTPDFGIYFLQRIYSTFADEEGNIDQEQIDAIINSIVEAIAEFFEPVDSIVKSFPDVYTFDVPNDIFLPGRGYVALSMCTLDLEDLFYRLFAGGDPGFSIGVLPVETDGVNVEITDKTESSMTFDVSYMSDTPMAVVISEKEDAAKAYFENKVLYYEAQAGIDVTTSTEEINTELGYDVTDTESYVEYGVTSFDYYLEENTEDDIIQLMNVDTTDMSTIAMASLFYDGMDILESFPNPFEETIDISTLEPGTTYYISVYVCTSMNESPECIAIPFTVGN